MAEKPADLTRGRQDTRLNRMEAPQRSGRQFGMLQRFADEMDRLFDDVGLGRTLIAPRSGWSALGSPWLGTSGHFEAWAPDVEIVQRGEQLVIRADLPGLQKDDVKIDVTDDTITIQGERKREHEEERDGIYRSERSYGGFSRVVQLPDGAMTDQAKASFRDGVLEITMPAPPEHVTRGRRLEITEGTASKK
jgi:HSP20 family protein